MLGFHAGLMLLRPGPCPPRNGEEGWGLLVDLKATGSLSQGYPDCPALGRGERHLSSAPIFRV